MSKSKSILTTAIATGIAVTAATSDAPAAPDEASLNAGDLIADDLLIFPEPDGELAELIGDWNPDEELITAPDDGSDLYLAQTLYGGAGNDGVVAPGRNRTGNGITLDNGLKKPGKGITLDNGIKKPGALKLQKQQQTLQRQGKKRKKK